MMEWGIIIGLVIAMYIIIYKYEKRMDRLHKMVEENRDKLEEQGSKIDKNRKHINENYQKLDEHNNHIEQMWVTLPKCKDGEQK